MPKIRVWGGEHPTEQAAVDLTHDLMRDPLPNVDAEIANQAGLAAGQRWIDENMAIVYPGNPQSESYESRRAVEVLEQSRGYGAVISLHDLSPLHSGEKAAYIDAERGISPRVLGMLRAFGICRVGIIDYNGLPRYADNGVVIDMMAKDHAANVPLLRQTLDDLANNPNAPRAAAADFQWFQHLLSLRVSDGHDPAVVASAGDTVRPFEPLPPAVVRGLGFAATAVICLGSWRPTPNPKGYWAEALTPIAVPDDTSWPRD